MQEDHKEEARYGQVLALTNMVRRCTLMKDEKNKI